MKSYLKKLFYSIFVILNCFAFYIDYSNYQIYQILYNTLINAHKKIEKCLHIKFNVDSVRNFSNFGKENVLNLVNFIIHMLFIFIIISLYKKI